MILGELLRGIEVVGLQGDERIEIRSLTSDSRSAAPGALFAAIRGLEVDGNRFARQAVDRGAVAILSDSPPADAVAPALARVPDARSALALVAANFFGHPADRLDLVGVTGTSGKTTTARMIESIVDATGEPAGLIGTIEYRAGSVHELADRTTPDAILLHEWFAKMVEQGVRRAVMEVSSHAIALERTRGIRFAVAVFTNLSRDHFDFHRDFEDYFGAKRRLFDQIDRSKKCAVVNMDDVWGRRLASELGDVVVGFGRGADLDVHPREGFEITTAGLRGRIATPAGDVRVESALLGLPNLYNWMAAIGASLACGISIDSIEEGIRRLESVRGRFERVSSDGDLTVLVDYAHKPDALEKLLRAVRDLAPARPLVLVIGCGGDRDRGKRPQMGEIAARLADRTILTSDNPRSESPEAILRGIEKGAETVAGAEWETVVDRRAAIERAIVEAPDDAVVVIAGKGHENYQVVGDRILHLDDREEAHLALAKRDKSSSKMN